MVFKMMKAPVLSGSSIYFYITNCTLWGHVCAIVPLDLRI